VVDHGLDVLGEVFLGEAELADDDVDVAERVVAELDLAGAEFSDGLGDIGVTVPDWDWASGLSVRALCPSGRRTRMVAGVRDGDVEFEPAAFDFLGEVFATGFKRSGLAAASHWRRRRTRSHAGSCRCPLGSEKDPRTS